MKTETKHTDADEVMQALVLLTVATKIFDKDRGRGKRAIPAFGRIMKSHEDLLAALEGIVLSYDERGGEPRAQIVDLARAAISMARGSLPLASDAPSESQTVRA